MQSIFDFLVIPAEVRVLLYTLSIIMIAAFFVAGVDIGVFRIPKLTRAQRRISLRAGLGLLVASILAGFPFLPKKDAEQNSSTDIACNEKLLGLPGSLHGLNEIGLIDTFSSTVVRGGNFQLGLKIRAEVDHSKLSCVSLYFCKPINANECKFRKQAIQPIRGEKNIYSMIIGDNFEAGKYRIHVKLVQVENESDLKPVESGALNIADYKLFGESRDFEVK